MSVSTTTSPTPTKGLRVVGLQLPNVDAKSLEDVQHNLVLASRYIHSDADLFVLGEMYTVGYGDEVFDQLNVLAEPLEVGATVTSPDAVAGRSFKFFAELAKRFSVHICYGFPQVHQPSSSSSSSPFYTISQAVVGPDGSCVALYQKLHVCSYGDCSESRWFTPGRKPCYFSIGKWRVGVMICYDVRFPELARSLAWEHGCDVILHPSAFPRDDSFQTWHPFVITRAVENQVYFLSLSRAGAHFGGSIVCPPMLDSSHSTSVLGTESGSLTFVADAAILAQQRKTYPFRTEVNPVVAMVVPRPRSGRKVVFCGDGDSGDCGRKGGWGKVAWGALLTAAAATAAVVLMKKSKRC